MASPAKIKENFKSLLEKTPTPTEQCALEFSEQIPKKWEKYDDFCLFPESATFSDHWLPGHYKLLAEVLRVKCLAKKSRTISTDEKRFPRIVPLYPSDLTEFWTHTMQYGIHYCWAPMHSLFCQGNITEKKRVQQLGQTDEVVLDLYAGIGYFVFPYLKYARVKRVIACEWNEWSVQGLLRGAKMNHFTVELLSPTSISDPINDSRICLFSGDHRDALPCYKGQVDRVNLGLLPSSEAGIPYAVAALRPDKGGWLHVHGNVKNGDQEAWKSNICELIQSYLTEEWRITCHHLEAVKSYAPLITHYVADIHCLPPPAIKQCADNKLINQENL